MGINVNDAYQVSFLTIRGWLYDKWEQRWYKEGCKRKLSYTEKESNLYYERNNLPKKYFGDDFLLEDAYQYQISLPIAEEPMMIYTIVYNTSDMIRYTIINGKQIVISIKTHDNIVWNIGDIK